MNSGYIRKYRLCSNFTNPLVFKWLWGLGGFIVQKKTDQKSIKQSSWNLIDIRNIFFGASLGTQINQKSNKHRRWKEWPPRKAQEWGRNTLERNQPSRVGCFWSKKVRKDSHMASKKQPKSDRNSFRKSSKTFTSLTDEFYSFWELSIVLIRLEG